MMYPIYYPWSVVYSATLFASLLRSADAFSELDHVVCSDQAQIIPFMSSVHILPGATPKLPVGRILVTRSGFETLVSLTCGAYDGDEAQSVATVLSPREHELYDRFWRFACRRFNKEGLRLKYRTYVEQTDVEQIDVEQIDVE